MLGSVINAGCCIANKTDGKFGAYMQVHIENDGPVTICLESPKSQTEVCSNMCNGMAERSNLLLINFMVL